MRTATSVYFIQAGDDGPIKIGVARDPLKRMASFKTARPEKLDLLAATPGSYPLERELHKRFAEHKVGREWFAPVPALLEYIKSIPPIEPADCEAVADHSWLFDFVTRRPAAQEWMRVPFGLELLHGGVRVDAATDGHRIMAVEGEWFSRNRAADYCEGLLSRFWQKSTGGMICALAPLREFAARPSVDLSPRIGVISGAVFDLDLLSPMLAAFVEDKVRIVACAFDANDMSKCDPLVLRGDGLMAVLMPRAEEATEAMPAFDLSGSLDK